MLSKVNDNKKNRGQALVEMALILPFLVLLIFGMMDFGRILNLNLTATQASREIARVAALKGTAADADTIVSAVAIGVTAELKKADPELKVLISPEFASARASGTDVTVNIIASVDIMTPGINTMITNPFPLHATTIMRVE